MIELYLGTLDLLGDYSTSLS